MVDIQKEISAFRKIALPDVKELQNYMLHVQDNITSLEAKGTNLNDAEINELKVQRKFVTALKAFFTYQKMFTDLMAYRWGQFLSTYRAIDGVEKTELLREIEYLKEDNRYLRQVDNLKDEIVFSNIKNKIGK